MGTLYGVPAALDLFCMSLADLLPVLPLVTQPTLLLGLRLIRISGVPPGSPALLLGLPLAAPCRGYRLEPLYCCLCGHRLVALLSCMGCCWQTLALGTSWSPLYFWKAFTIA